VRQSPLRRLRLEDRNSGKRMSDKNEHSDGRPPAAVAAGAAQRDKRRVMVTQLLRSPVFNPAGEELGRLADIIVKLDVGGGGYPPVTGTKVRMGGRDVFVSRKNIEKLAPGEVRLNTQTLDTGAFQRRPGEVLLAADVLGRHLVDMVRGRIVQAHDLVLAHGDDGWRLMGVDRSPRAMLRRLVPRRGRPDLRKHALLDWKDLQPFVGQVPTAKLLMPLQRLRRLHPAQIADIVEGATHEEGEEILDAIESDAELTADVFEEMDTEHQVEFLRSLANEEAAKVLERMAPDDAADLIGELDQDRRKPVFDLMSPTAQHKLRKLLQYHPSTAGGMMSPDYVWVIRGSTVAMALEAVRIDDKAPHQLLNTVFVTEQDGRLIGSISTADLLRSEGSRKVDELELVNCKVTTGADVTDVTLTMADYNLVALAVTDAAGNLLGAVTADDVIEAIVPEQWRARLEASTGV
jgi:CBS domain-containing protein/sporulation protein YlmC with PRC-barrel domain